MVCSQVSICNSRLVMSVEIKGPYPALFAAPITALGDARTETGPPINQYAGHHRTYCFFVLQLFRLIGGKSRYTKK